MKILIYILTALTLISCNTSDNNEKRKETAVTELESENAGILKDQEPQKSENEIEQIEKVNCWGTSTDFLKLKDEELQSNLFSKIDSIRKVQYPDNDQETSIMVDLTPEYLNKFLSDIDSDSLRDNNLFAKEYHFNIAPKGYTDPVDCKDKIALSFDPKSCSFRLNIYNTFLVEPNWCTESMVVYGFKISTDKIVAFWRQEAG